MNTINAVNEIVGLTADDRTLGLSSLEFDLSVHDMFGPLNVGGAVVTLTEQERRDAEAWIGLMTRHHVTQLYCVPPLLDMLLSSTSTTQLDELRWCLLGGDWVTLDLPGRLRERATTLPLRRTWWRHRNRHPLDLLRGYGPRSHRSDMGIGALWQPTAQHACPHR